VKVVIIDAARDDLRRIGLYIAETDPHRAGVLVEMILDGCGSLADMPARYPLVPRFEQSGIRRRPCGQYLIFYRIVNATVEVVHILHGAMDYEAILFPAN